MKLRGIVLADLHARRNSLEHNLTVLDYAEARYKDRKCNFFLSLGDLLHDRVSIHSKTWIRLRRRLKEMQVRAYYLKGNHDSPDDSYEMCILEQLDWPSSTPVLEPTYISDSVSMVLYPYDSDLSKPLLQTSVPDLLGGHFSVLGSKVGPEDWEVLAGTSLTAIPEAGLRVLGHHHKHQWLDEHTCYVGAPFPTSYGECNEDKVILEVELNEHTGKFQATPLQVPGLPRYYELTINTPEDLEHVTSVIHGNRVRVISSIPIPESSEAKWKSEADSGGFQCLYVPPPKQKDFQLQIDPTHFSLTAVIQEYILATGSAYAPKALELFDTIRSESVGEYDVKPGRIELLWLRMQNFGPHVDTWVSLKKTGLVGVEGANVSDASAALQNFSDDLVMDSNTAGKSHIFDAIVWAWTGETISTGPRDSLDDLVRKGQSSCQVTLAANVRGQYTEIVRGRPKLLKLSVDHVENRSHDLESEVRRHLGFGKETLVQTVLLGQRVRSLLHFMDLGDAEQRRLIDHHVGITALDAWIKSAAQGLASADAQVQACKKFISDSGLPVAEGKVESHLREAETWGVEHTRRITDAQQALKARQAELEPQVAALETCKATLVQAVSDLASAAWEEASSVEEYEDLVSTLQEWETYERSLSGKLLTLQGRRASPQANVGKITQKLEAGESVCPQCLQTVSKEYLEDLKAQYEAEVQDLDVEIEGVQSALQECAVALSEGRGAKEDLESVLSSTNTLSDTARASAQRVRDLESEIKNACTQESYTLTSAQAEINPHLEALDRALVEVDTIKSTLVLKEQELAQLEHVWFSWTLLLESLGYKSGKGVRMPIYAAFQSRLNELLSLHCLRLSKNKYTVQVWLVDQKANGEWIDKYRIVLIGESGEIPVKRASGGQLRRINLAFVLSLRELFEELCGVTCNFLGIDEVFDGLDSVGKESIADLLPTLLNRIESVWAISQEPQLQRLFSTQRLVCLNERGIKTIVVPRGAGAEALIRVEGDGDERTQGWGIGGSSPHTANGSGGLCSSRRGGKLSHRV